MKLSQQLSISVFALASTALLMSAYTPDYVQVDKYDAALAPSFTGGAPASRTGAPGESNCTSCHAGSVLDGSNENVLDLKFQGNSVTNYMPGETYTVHLSMASAPNKKGFQATVLNGGNNFVGQFSAMSSNGVQTLSGMGRSYAGHTSNGTGAGTTEWVWDWVAPTSDEGMVTFYVATNKANGSGSGGDQIYTSSHAFGAMVNLEEIKPILDEFEVGYAPQSNKAFIILNSQIAGASSINVTDMNGKSVHTAFLGATKIGSNKFQVSLPEHLSNGQYIMNFFVNNRSASGLFNIAR